MFLSNVLSHTTPNKVFHSHLAHVTDCFTT